MSDVGLRQTEESLRVCTEGGLRGEPGLALAVRMGVRELRGGFRRFWVFLLCLALGVGAIATVGLLRKAIEEGLRQQGAVLLGGDASIRLTYRFATERERQALAAAAATVAEVVEFRSMAIAGGSDLGERALTQVRAVDDAWPLYGAPRLEPALPLTVVFAGRDGLPGAAMDPVLVARLGLTLGDRFRLGGRDFVLMAELLREPDGLGSDFGIGPRTLVETKALAGSGLLEPGSMFAVEYRLRAQEGQSLEALRAAVMPAFDAGARWRDRGTVDPQLGRFVDRIGSFLVLVGLAGLAVGGVGIAAAVQAYLAEKVPVIATFKVLGATGRTIVQIYFVQIGILAAAGIGLGLALAVLAAPSLLLIWGDALPLPYRLGLYPAPLAEATLYGALTTLLFTLWPLARVEQVRAAALYRGSFEALSARPRMIWAGAVAGAGVLLIAAAMSFAALWQLALATAAAVGVALLMLVFAARGMRALARRLARAQLVRGWSALRLALAAVGSPREGVTAVVMALGLGLSVLAAVGQVDANLRGAILRELPQRAPTFFMIDIQPHQLEGLLSMLSADTGVGAIETAPQLRGVITAVNGIPSQELPEHWIFLGDRGVTYADRLPEGVRIVAGQWWGEGYHGPPLISLGAEQARETGIGVGDQITVSILGREITGTVANLREVDFRTGGIGFVLLFNEAALRGAPHTYLLTAHVAPEAEARVLRAVTNAYPNVSVIRIREAIERVNEALSGLATATAAAAFSTLVTGFVVLIGASAAAERGRLYEAAVLKVLGATRRRILVSFALRSALMGAAAGLVALLAGSGAAFLAVAFVLELPFILAAGPAATIVLGGICATLAAGLFFALRPLAARPARVLRTPA